MFGRKPPKVASSVGHFNSMIDASMTIAGPVTFTNVLKVAGHIAGDVTGMGFNSQKIRIDTLVVEKTGIVHGDISADAVIIQGKVIGNIKAKTVCILTEAELLGDYSIEYEYLNCQPGAKVSSKLIHKQPEYDQKGIEVPVEVTVPIN